MGAGEGGGPSGSTDTPPAAGLATDDTGVAPAVEALPSQAAFDATAPGVASAPVDATEIPDTAPYIVPMDMDHHRHGYSTTVDLGRLSSTIGTAPKATTVHILIGRPRGEQVEPLLSRTVIITIAIPGYADHHRGPADLSLQMTVGLRHLQHAPADLALLEGQVNEEELVGTRNLARQDGYWKMLQGLIRQRLQDDPGGRQVTALRRGPGIGFRLYANGEAQLIEVERSSGDLKLDQAALLAVVNAHPFPPFPPGTSDNYVDVHVEVPPRAY